GAGRPILLCWTTARPYSSSQSPCASSNRRTASSKHHSLRIARQLTSVTLRRRTPDRSELAAAASFAVPVVATAASARSPTAGVIVAVAAVGVAALVRVSRWPLPEVVIMAMIIPCAFVDLPRRIGFGPVSGGAALTTLAAGAGVVAWILAYRRNVALVTRPLV